MSNREKIELKQEEVICWLLAELEVSLYANREIIEEASEKLMQLIEPKEEIAEQLLNRERYQEDFFGQMKGAQE